MPSPFPGMNPYLEQEDTWEDFHQRFLTHAADGLSELVGGNYLVKIEVRLYFHELSAEERRYFGRADVGETTPPASGLSGPGAAAAAGPRRKQRASQAQHLILELAVGGKRIPIFPYEHAGVSRDVVPEVQGN